MPTPQHAYANGKIQDAYAMAQNACADGMTRICRRHDTHMATARQTYGNGTTCIWQRHDTHMLTARHAYADGTTRSTRTADAIPAGIQGENDLCLHSDTRREDNFSAYTQYG